MWLEENHHSYETEYNCPIAPVNPKTGHKLPFDVCIPNLKLIIEIHGQQHYSDQFYRTRLKMDNETARRELRKRQVIDRYKKIKAIVAGYSYLELPYYSFDIKNENESFYYTKLLQEKINSMNQQ